MPRSSRLPILLAVACALILRSLVPAGWMPAAAGGAFAIEPCPAATEQVMIHMAGHHGAKRDPAHRTDHNGECAFSPLSTGLGSVDIPVALLPPIQPEYLPASAREASPFKTGPPALPPPATGPPIIA
jgi:hypothetical protein